MKMSQSSFSSLNQIIQPLVIINGQNLKANNAL